jgi:hypothetical protein
MKEFPYLGGYPEQVTAQVRTLIAEGRLGTVLLRKYPAPHDIRTDKALYAYALAIKNASLRQSPPLSKVVFDGKIQVVHQALGLHTFASRVQGGKLKAKNEIRIGAVFKVAPPECLRMIVVHELAHLREKEHNRAFYQLCNHMEPAYHQLEFDLRLYLTHLELFGALYREGGGAGGADRE